MEFHGWVGLGGGPTYNIVNPTRVEVELGCDNGLEGGRDPG